MYLVELKQPNKSLGVQLWRNKLNAYIARDVLNHLNRDNKYVNATVQRLEAKDGEIEKLENKIEVIENPPAMLYKCQAIVPFGDDHLAFDAENNESPQFDQQDWVIDNFLFYDSGKHEERHVEITDETQKMIKETLHDYMKDFIYDYASDNNFGIDYFQDDVDKADSTYNR